jgi:hypothetical protein
VGFEEEELFGKVNKRFEYPVNGDGRVKGYAIVKVQEQAREI